MQADMIPTTQPQRTHSLTWTHVKVMSWSDWYTPTRPLEPLFKQNNHASTMPDAASCRTASICRPDLNRKIVRPVSTTYGGRDFSRR
jgi:hypothetical protein